MDAALLARAREIRLLTCDVDGVLTDGRIYVGHDGQEYKAFWVLDGVGLKRIAEIGVAVALLSGSKAPAIMNRAHALGIARASAPNCPTCRCSHAAASPTPCRTRPMK